MAVSLMLMCGLHGSESQRCDRTSEIKTIELEFHINGEYLADHSYIDMTGFFPRSNGKVHVTSAV
jgi:hypothetical protein